MNQLLYNFLLVLTFAPLAYGAEASFRLQSISLNGSPKYQNDFAHFDFVNVSAPKGGFVKTSTDKTFQTLYPYAWANNYQNKPAPYLDELVFETLLTTNLDESDTAYGLLAKEIEISKNFDFVIFHIDPKSRFSNGEAVTAEDVLFSYLDQRQSTSQFETIWSEVRGAKVLDRLQIRFDLSSRNWDQARKTILSLGEIIVLNKEYSMKHKPETWGQKISPLGTGPYLVKKFLIDNNVEYERRKDYWAEENPVRRGFYNFGSISVTRYLDPSVALLALQKGDLQFKDGLTETAWKHLKKTIDQDSEEQKRLVMYSTTVTRPTGMIGLRFNLDREKFRDRRVREALILAYPFDTINQLMYNKTQTRTESLFQNTVYAAGSLASDSEKRILSPHLSSLSPDLFSDSFVPRQNEDDSFNRKNLLLAAELLKQSGWHIKDGTLTNQRGQIFEIEAFYGSSRWEKVFPIYKTMLARLGIHLIIRRVEQTELISRLQSREFDLVPTAIRPQSAPNSDDLDVYFSSERARKRELTSLGIENPVIDDLIKRLTEAENTDDKIALARSLDRVVQSERYILPLGVAPIERLAASRLIEGPKPSPQSGFQVLKTWWFRQ